MEKCVYCLTETDGCFTQKYDFHDVFPICERCYSVTWHMVQSLGHHTCNWDIVSLAWALEFRKEDEENTAVEEAERIIRECSL